jgi:hypothetical protein
MLFTGGRLLLFAVGLKLMGKSDHVVVDGEDALIAALKAKAQYPWQCLLYLRKQTVSETASVSAKSQKRTLMPSA